MFRTLREFFFRMSVLAAVSLVTLPAPAPHVERRVSHAPTGQGEGERPALEQLCEIAAGGHLLRETIRTLNSLCPRDCHYTLPKSSKHVARSDIEYNKRWMWLAGGLVLLSMAVASGGEVWEESDHEVLIRSERGAKNRENCRYTKSAWTECDPKTNVRARTLTLKKGDPASCERTKTIQKKCKKACRYEKSSWSECSPNGEMSRTDMLKANSDPTCDKSRRVTKKCNKNKQVKASKDKGRRNRQ